MSEITVHRTSIPGLLHFGLVVNCDRRGWFKESYQRAKLEALGLPRMEVLQNNVSYNAEIGVTRGVHAEPWDKYISLVTGRVFAAIADLRAGATFGRVETFELTAAQALYVPRGCGNAFQTLEEHTTYSYLVNEHWSPEARYVLVSLFDPTLAIPWPVPREQMIIGDKDLGHPELNAIRPKRVKL
jgi:dTDP-4-dehydrorhamnose 3,5-epimerase